MNGKILYEVGRGLYFNITNRCPCDCEFCVRNNGDGINEGESLWLTREPTLGELRSAIEKTDLRVYDEAVFCGYGEPSERLDIILEIAWLIKQKSNLPVRLNTNGLSDLINGKPTAHLLTKVIDRISISLNAATREEYNELCRPDFGPEAFDAMISFAQDCKKEAVDVNFTVVSVIGAEKIAECQKLCDGLGIRLKIRELIE